MHLEIETEKKEETGTGIDDEFKLDQTPQMSDLNIGHQITMLV